MIKVAGLWELGWSAPISEHDLWSFPLRAFGVEEWYMSPISGIARRVTELPNIQEVVETNPNLTPIYIDEQGSAKLQDFKHPENALYIFGKAGLSPWKAIGKQGISVRIENEVEGGLLWPHQCAAMVLYDRMVKSCR